METESHNEKVAYLNGYLDFVEEHSCKDDREPQQQEIKDVVARHTALLEQSSRVLTVGRQALPVWQEYNDTTTKLSEWMMECHQKLCLGQYQSGNAMVTKQSLENCKVSNNYMIYGYVHKFIHMYSCILLHTLMEVRNIRTNITSMFRLLLSLTMAEIFNTDHM